jgi:hypothetical protein
MEVCDITNESYRKVEFNRGVFQGHQVKNEKVKLLEGYWVTYQMKGLNE